MKNVITEWLETQELYWVIDGDLAEILKEWEQEVSRLVDENAKLREAYELMRSSAHRYAIWKDGTIQYKEGDNYYDKAEDIIDSL